MILINVNYQYYIVHPVTKSSLETNTTDFITNYTNNFLIYVYIKNIVYDFFPATFKCTRIMCVWLETMSEILLSHFHLLSFFMYFHPMFHTCPHKWTIIVGHCFGSDIIIYLQFTFFYSEFKSLSSVDATRLGYF